MRERSFQYYDKSAKKQTVSLTINSDLMAKAKEAGLNASQIAEDAIARIFVEGAREKLSEELKKEAEAYDEFVRKHGSLAEMARQHYAEKEGAEAAKRNTEDAV